MTLCIAAVSGNSILMVADTRVALGYTSGEALIKASKVNQKWAVMFAGNDIGRSNPILEGLKHSLWGQPGVTRQQMEHAITLTMQTEHVKRIEAQVLSPYGWTMPEFTKAVGGLPADMQADLRHQIERTELGCEFLVCGFDEQDRPHIFHARERGLVDDYCRLGFWAIGSGALAAIHMLLYQQYRATLPQQEAAYRCCSAKFFAEPADLGRKTAASVFGLDGSVLTYSDMDAIRRIWEQSGAPRIPEDLTRRMPGLIPIDRPTRPATRRGRKARPPSRA